MKKPFIWLMGATIALGYAGCKKHDTATAPPPAPPKDTASLATKWKDTSALIARDLYLWYNNIPASFDPRQYADPNGVMVGIRQFSNEPGYSAPVDRWSFGMLQTEWNQTSSGVSQDLGLYVFFLTDGDLRVRYVERNGPAELAGIKRGWQITGINGNTNMTVANANYIVQNIYYATGATNITFTKPDNSSVTIALNLASYYADPLLKDTTYNIGGKSIGYMVFNSFLGDSANVSNSFNKVFNRFATANVSDVIVDLRYNGGGYVNYSQLLADYLVPTSANGKMMMTQKFNDKYTQYNSTNNFTKQGTLNLGRVFFITSRNTASASELLINNLKPYMGIQLIGDTTHGKPVGFFPVPVGTWYVFPVSFRNINANGDANYFNGFVPSKLTWDGIDKDWGDITENRLSYAIKYITTGAYRMGAPGDADRMDVGLRDKNQLVRGPQFEGSVARRPF